MLFLPPLELSACPACCGVLPSASFAPAGAVTFEPVPRFRPDARAFFLLCQDTYRPHGGHDLPVWVGRAFRDGPPSARDLRVGLVAALAISVTSDFMTLDGKRALAKQIQSYLILLTGPI